MSTKVSSITEGASYSNDQVSATITKHFRTLLSLSMRHRWKTYWEYLRMAIISTACPNFFEVLTFTGNSNEPTLIHLFLSYMFIGIPVYCMEVSLGKYSQAGIVLLRKLSPLARGLEVTFTLAIIGYIVRNGILLSIYLIYFLSSMQSTLQWMVCYGDDIGTRSCWNGSSDCHQNCFSNPTELSAWIYFTDIFMGIIDTSNETLHLSLPSFSKLTLMFGTWSLFVVFYTNVTSKYYKQQLYLFLYAWLVLITLLWWGLAFTTRNSSLRQVLRVDWRKFLREDVWGITLVVTIKGLALGRPFHIIHGSFMTPHWPTGLLSLSFVILTFFVTFLNSAMTQTCLIMIWEAALLKKPYGHKKGVKISHRNMMIFFGFIPQALGLMYVPQFWTAVYFLAGILLLVNCQAAHINIMERTLIESYPKLLRYRKYVASVIYFSGCLLGVLLSSNESYKLFTRVFFYLLNKVEHFNVVVLSIFVCWFYGVQRFCDDLHYITGAQPSKFWKVSWHSMPVVLIITHFYVMYRHRINSDIRTRWLEIMLYVLFISPVPVIAVFEMIKFIKNRNFGGLFKTDISYGLPDVYDRFLRRTYNPREEVRCKRRTERCHHRCFLLNKILKRLKEQELLFKQKSSDE